MNADNSKLPDRRPARGTSGHRLLAAAVVFTAAMVLSVAIVAIARGCTDAIVRRAVLQGVCWLLVSGGVIGTYLASGGRRWAWLILFGLQPVWIAYAVTTGQPGFVLGSVAYAGAQLNGWLRGAGA